MKIGTCLGQITLSKIDEICPSAIPKQTTIISMHTPSLVKIHWYLLKLSSGNENTDLSQANNSSKIDKICPLTIPSQISTITMHTPSLVKIHLHLLKLLSGNKNMDGRTDGRTTDGMTDGRDTIIPCHYHVAGYKMCTPEALFLGEMMLVF